jgi:hypothetical protein
MRSALLLLITLGLLATAPGCTPRVKIRKTPGPHDTGLRYYRPKPYLCVEPAGQVVTVKTTSTTTPSDEFVSISLEYLPDFSEEYSIHVRPGLGSADVSVTLDQGWNLTSLNQNLDTQFDENVEALAKLAEAGAGFLPTAEGGDAAGAPPGSVRKWVVPATNVPIGYYESVISKDACGKKRLFGWRYVGFMPYAACPTEACGVQGVSCQEMPTPLFGLVFRDGVMVFQRLDAGLEHPDLNRRDVSTGVFTVTSVNLLLDSLNKTIRIAILEQYGAKSRVKLSAPDDLSTVQIGICLVDPVDRTSRQEFIRDLIVDENVEAALEKLGNPLPEFASIAGLSEEPDGGAGNAAALKMVVEELEPGDNGSHR